MSRKRASSGVVGGGGGAARSGSGGARESAGRGTEAARVALLAKRLAAPGASGVGVGIGDDAAVLDPVDGSLVWTIDAQVDGTHFRMAWLGWEDVGWRSFMAAASDLAAMGATPVAALSALTLADDVDDAALDALARGQADAARAVSAPVVGGNLARGRETSITTTLLGRAERPVLRSGAREGDGVYLAGAVGMAAAGLLALERGAHLGDPSVDACVDAWRRPRALVERGLAMRGLASAAVDVSDGLACDAGHLAEASAVTLLFDERLLRARAGDALERAAALLGRDLLDMLVHGGGEDYALLVTSPSPIEGFDRVGVVEGDGPGVSLLRIDGARTAVDPRGFDHFG
ncbi:MAG: thiamine-phosphate kinase [Labilithrix sp.]|nr:thiamine-phosphate kinase [Labilithrix sp.]